MGDKDLTPLSEVQKDGKQVCVIYHSILVGISMVMCSLCQAHRMQATHL